MECLGDVNLLLDTAILISHKPPLLPIQTQEPILRHSVL